MTAIAGSCGKRMPTTSRGTGRNYCSERSLTPAWIFPASAASRRRTTSGTRQAGQERTEGPPALRAGGGRERGFRLPRARRISRWAGGFAAAAAVVVLAFIFGSHTSPAQASAEALVRDAMRVHQIPMDRCYL